MAFKVPIVSTDVHGIPDMVKDRAEAWLVKPGDHLALARLIKTCLDKERSGKSFAPTGLLEGAAVLQLRTRAALPRQPRARSGPRPRFRRAARRSGLAHAVRHPRPHSPTGRDVLIAALFVLALGFNGWAVSVGWKHANLPGQEFRQAQTAISAYFIKQEHNFSLAYPTPVLGKPWSAPFEFPPLPVDSRWA